MSALLVTIPLYVAERRGRIEIKVRSHSDVVAGSDCGRSLPRDPAISAISLMRERHAHDRTDGRKKYRKCRHFNRIKRELSLLPFSVKGLFSSDIVKAILNVFLSLKFLNSLKIC